MELSGLQEHGQHDHEAVYDGARSRRVVVDQLIAPEGHVGQTADCPVEQEQAGAVGGPTERGC